MLTQDIQSQRTKHHQTVSQIQTTTHSGLIQYCPVVSFPCEYVNWYQKEATFLDLELPGFLLEQ